jgi:hypothetical protein
MARVISGGVDADGIHYQNSPMEIPDEEVQRSIDEFLRLAKQWKPPEIIAVSEIFMEAFRAAMKKKPRRIKQY